MIGGQQSQVAAKGHGGAEGIDGFKLLAASSHVNLKFGGLHGVRFLNGDAGDVRCETKPFLPVLVSSGQDRDSEDGLSHNRRGNRKRVSGVQLREDSGS